MAHDLTESAAGTGSVTVPDDGDDLDAASVQVPFQTLTDRTRKLLDFLEEGASIPSPVNFGDAVAVGGDFTVSGALTQIVGELITGDDVNVGGNLAAPTADITDLDVGHDLNVANDAGVVGELTVGGLFTATAGSVLVGTTIANGLIDASQGVRRKLRIVTYSDDTDHAFLGASYDRVRVTFQTGPHDFTVQDTGARDGDSLRITNVSTQNVVVKIPGPSTLTTVPPGSTTPQWVDLIRTGGVWVLDGGNY